MTNIKRRSRVSRTARTASALALGVGAMVVAADPAGAARIPGSDQGGKPLTATLSGAAEIPGPGDTDGTGTALVTVNLGQRTVCFQLTVANIEPATAAHIHVGGPGAAGPVAVGLVAPSTGSSLGCVGVNKELAKQLIQNPDNYYVNVHNAGFPGGAVRGQLS